MKETLAAMIRAIDDGAEFTFDREEHEAQRLMRLGDDILAEKELD